MLLLLNERGISQQDPVPGKWGEVPTIFAMPEENLTVPFDIFSAVFFLLSRYEEYCSYTPDKHGRYPAEESILYKQGWLRRPLADEWVSALGKLLRDKGFETKRPAFFFQPSYDIDIAYSYLHKGRRRSLGAFLRDLLKGNARQLGDRISVGRLINRS